MFKIASIDFRSDPPLYQLASLANEKVKGNWYREELVAVPKLNGILNQIVSQRVKKGVAQLKIKPGGKAPAVWRNIEDFIMNPSK